MSAASSPSSLSDYFIIQPHSFRDLPVRLRSPNRHSEQDSQLSEDEFECISSPDTVRSLNSTPVAGSVRSVSVDDDHSEQLEDHQPGIASSVHDRTISSSACGEISVRRCFCTVESLHLPGVYEHLSKHLSQTSNARRAILANLP